jgi:hypothetical protein
MTPHRYTTPGTRLTWSRLADWVETAHRIDRRRLSEARNRALAAHADALPRDLINRESRIPALEAALHLLKYGPPGLARPPKGARAGHPTTAIIMDLMNCLAVLKRQDEMPPGDNWTTMFGGSDANSI